MSDKNYLRLLSSQYPTSADVAARIIKLRAVMSLPKGTEYFFSDLHGEYRAFIHIINSASGVVLDTINDIFSITLDDDEREQLAQLIYYPEDVITPELVADTEKWRMWSRVTVYRLIYLLRHCSAKYSHSHVVDQFPDEYATLLDELLYTDRNNKPEYIEALVTSSVDTGIASDLIVAMCQLVQQLIIDQLHIIGDIFDRGPRADRIVDRLMEFHNVDIQWGNHDLCYLGAASGCYPLIANAIRVSISFNNFDFLQDGYGINLRALATFASETYRDDPCERFIPRKYNSNKYDKVGDELAAKMHKAIAVIQYKLEGQVIRNHPEYGMDDRNVLERIDFERNVIDIEGVEYPLADASLPTVDPKAPLVLTRGEEELMYALASSFRHSERFQKHARFLLSHGSTYKMSNGNLLYHGGIILNENGELDGFDPLPGAPKGRELMDQLDEIIRRAYYAPSGTDSKHEARDMLWYLTCGKKSPIYAKSKTAAFEKYFIDDKAAYHEEMNPYYSYIEDPATCQMILSEFGMDPDTSHIINGHVPVKLRLGESPVKGGGRLYVIDGGLSKAYQGVTGIGGYTFIEHCDYVAFAVHATFNGEDESYFKTSPKIQTVERMMTRLTIADTDQGCELIRQIAELEELLNAYRSGELHEKPSEVI